jgi:hypothetical protein
LLREGVRLATGERIRLDFVLEAGSVSESVLIKSDAPSAGDPRVIQLGAKINF